MQLIKNQHYVPQFYLKEWKKPEFFVYNKTTSTITKRSIETIASQKYFYKIKYLTEKEVNFLKLILDYKKPKHIAEYNDKIIKMHSIANAIINPEIRTKNQEFQRIQKLIESNFDDSYHSTIESTFEPIIKSIRKREFDFLSDLDKISEFEYDFIQQYLRTKKMKVKIIESLKKTNEELKVENKMNPFENLDFEALWNVLIKVYASEISYNLGVKFDCKFTILINQTDTPFITSDQPIINIAEGETKDWIYYYPVALDIGILYTNHKINEFVENPQSLTVDEVLYFNSKIYNKAFIEVYSNSEEILQLVSK